MTLSESIQSQITALEWQLSTLNPSGLAAQLHEAQNCNNRYGVTGCQNFLNAAGEAWRNANTKLGQLRLQLQNAIQFEKDNPPPPEPVKVIPNNEIIGPDLVPVQTVAPTGQINKIPVLPIVAGVGILIVAGALLKKRKKR